MKVHGEHGSGCLLGAHLVRIEGAAKPIDVFAAALHAAMTVHDVQCLDLSYASPFARVWDPYPVRRAQGHRGALNRMGRHAGATAPFPCSGQPRSGDRLGRGCTRGSLGHGPSAR